MISVLTEKPIFVLAYQNRLWGLRDGGWEWRGSRKVTPVPQALELNKGGGGSVPREQNFSHQTEPMVSP